MQKIDMKKLGVRTLSAAVLAPTTLLLVYLGGWYFIAFIVIGAGIALYEWVQLSLKTTQKILLGLGGVVYIFAAAISFYVLREISFQVALLFFVSVWVSDIGAYFTGKFIGGAKMLPSVSPNKTWAGLMGALLCPGALLSFLLYLEAGAWVFGFVFGVLIGVFGQLGDLMISSLKRLAVQKDAGELIPGHGGLLDRIDSLMLVSIFMLIFYYIQP